MRMRWRRSASRGSTSPSGASTTPMSRTTKASLRSVQFFAPQCHNQMLEQHTRENARRRSTSWQDKSCRSYRPERESCLHGSTNFGSTIVTCVRTSRTHGARASTPALRPCTHVLIPRSCSGRPLCNFKRIPGVPPLRRTHIRGRTRESARKSVCKSVSARDRTALRPTLREGARASPVHL